jgi:hypothetical protein
MYIKPLPLVPGFLKFFVSTFAHVQTIEASGSLMLERISKMAGSTTRHRHLLEKHNSTYT